MSDTDTLRSIVQRIVSTRTDEIDCDNCFERLDSFVEMILTGTGTAVTLLRIQDHLDHCPDCREEFEALRDILEAEGKEV